MYSSFDRMAKMAVSSISNLMGETAFWLSSRGDKQLGRVLFKDPSEPVQIGDSEGYEYRPSNATAEYHEDVFPGLRQAVNDGRAEYIEIRGQKYSITAVSTKFDGRIHTAQLEPHTDEHDGNE